jgi:hypothetical protein
MGGGPMWPRDGTWGMPLAGTLVGTGDCKEPAVEWVVDKACMEAVEAVEVVSTLKRYEYCGCCRCCIVQTCVTWLCQRQRSPVTNSPFPEWMCDV